MDGTKVTRYCEDRERVVDSTESFVYIFIQHTVLQKHVAGNRIRVNLVSDIVPLNHRLWVTKRAQRTVTHGLNGIV